MSGVGRRMCDGVGATSGRPWTRAREPKAARLWPLLMCRPCWQSCMFLAYREACAVGLSGRCASGQRAGKVGTLPVAVPRVPAPDAAQRPSQASHASRVILPYWEPLAKLAFSPRCRSEGP
jgi:hypothetical protein